LVHFCTDKGDAAKFSTPSLLTGRIMEEDETGSPYFIGGICGHCVGKGGKLLGSWNLFQDELTSGLDLSDFSHDLIEVSQRGHGIRVI
jgi:hypothetical protein